MWGSPSPERHIMIDGKTVRVRDNIWRCLKHLRDNHELNSRSRLWIDSICINQNDEQEKSQQVAKMAQIFQIASRVLIWLGSTSLQTYLLTPGTDSLQDSIESLPPEDWDAWSDVLGHSDPRSRSLENQMMSIVYNSYWERLWIAQETALARNACIVFGKALLNEDCIRAMYNAARENSRPGYRSWIARQRDPNIRNSGTGLLDHHPMLRIRRSQETGQDCPTSSSSSLRDLVNEFHWKRCTEPRDYVFGLVGLLDPCRPLEIDYTASNEEVAIRALRYLEEEGTLEEVTHPRGLDLSAAAALFKALTVTSATYSRFEQGLSLDMAEAMQVKKCFRLSFRPLVVLATGDNVLQPEIEAVPYEDVIQLNVSGTLQENLYLMKRPDFLQLRLLDGQLKQFAYARDSNQLEKKSGVVLLCLLGIVAQVLVRWDPNDERTIKIEHFIRPDMTRQLHESLLSLEILLPINVQVALQREINTCRGDWDNLRSDTWFDSFLHLSTLELVSMCELIAPKANGCG
jgi:hypothetical protein